MKIKIWATASFDIILKVLPKVQQYVDAETCWCAEETQEATFVFEKEMKEIEREKSAFFVKFWDFLLKQCNYLFAMQ